MVTATPKPPRRARMALSAYFMLTGLATAAWASRIPAVKQQLHLSNNSLSFALLAIPVGFIIVMPAAGRLADRFGSARMTSVSLAANCLALLLPGVARSQLELTAALLALGLSGGCLNVAINTHGGQVEAAYGRPVMASLHASYSLGGLVGAVFGGLMASAAASPEATFAAVGVPGVVVAGALMPCLLIVSAQEAAQLKSLLSHDEQNNRPREKPRVPYTIASATDRRSYLQRHVILALGIIVFCDTLCEGAVTDWSAVYLRDSLAAAPEIAIAGYAAFSVTMLFGRLVGDRLAARWGPTNLVRCCGLFAAVGLGSGLLSNSCLGGITGFAIFGAGLSCISPRAFAAAGSADSSNPGQRLARVAGLGYVGFGSGPIMIGMCASLIGLRLALFIPVMFAIWTAVLAGALAP